MSYSIAITHPEKVKGIAVFSGRILEEVKSQLLKKDLKKLHLFLSHGIQDTVLSIDGAREAKRLLQDKLDLSYHEYNDVHTINRSMFSDFKAWLLSNLH